MSIDLGGLESYTGKTMPAKGWSKKAGRVTSPTSGKRKRQMRIYWRKAQKLKDPLTEREKQILYFIRTYQCEELCSPTATEIGGIFYVSQGVAARNVRNLVAKGFLQTTTDKGRSWRIKFPKGVMFPWEDEKQFPRTVFLPKNEREA